MQTLTYECEECGKSIQVLTSRPYEEPTRPRGWEAAWKHRPEIGAGSYSVVHLCPDHHQRNAEAAPGPALEEPSLFG